MTQTVHRKNKNGGIIMDNTGRKILCMSAGTAAGLAAAFAAVTVLSVSLPVALGIGYVFAGSGIAAAASMDG